LEARAFVAVGVVLEMRVVLLGFGVRNGVRSSVGVSDGFEVREVRGALVLKFEVLGRCWVYDADGGGNGV